MDEQRQKLMNQLYYERHREEILERRKAEYRADPDKYRQRVRKHRAAKADYYREKERGYYRKHKDSLLEKSREYYSAHRAEISWRRKQKRKEQIANEREAERAAGQDRGALERDA